MSAASESKTATAERARLHLRSGAAPEVSLLPPDMLDKGRADALVAYGKRSSLIIATRNPGYHSKPHRHAAEQLNYLLTGEVWVFTNTDGFLVRPGDILRIPENEVHWAWVQGTEPATVIEVHTPALTLDYAAGRRSLCVSEEEEQAVVHVGNEWVPDWDWRSIERRIVGYSFADLEESNRK
jgi:quercetin dioxygenase-like cupin family protein